MWAQGLRNCPELITNNNFVRTIEKITAYGIIFPPTGANTGKYDPPVRAMKQIPSNIPTWRIDQPRRQNQENANVSSAIDAEYVQRMKEIKTNADLLKEMLQHFDPKSERIENNEVVRELIHSINEFRGYLSKIVEKDGVREELVGPSLELIDQLNQLIKGYDLLRKDAKTSVMGEDESSRSKSVTAFDLLEGQGGNGTASNSFFSGPFVPPKLSPPGNQGRAPPPWVHTLSSPQPPYHAELPPPKSPHSKTEKEDSDFMAEFQSIANRPH